MAWLLSIELSPPCTNWNQPCVCSTICQNGWAARWSFCQGVFLRKLPWSPLSPEGSMSRCWALIYILSPLNNLSLDITQFCKFINLWTRTLVKIKGKAISPCAVIYFAKAGVKLTPWPYLSLFIKHRSHLLNVLKSWFCEPEHWSRWRRLWWHWDQGSCECLIQTCGDFFLFCLGEDQNLVLIRP